MTNLIPLSLIILSTYTFASGHHRGEQDIELSPSIMSFLSEMKKREFQNDIDVSLMKLKEFIISIEIDIPGLEEHTHYNTPIKNAVPDDDKKVE